MSPDAYAIRPIQPSDKEALQRFHARLSAEARYRRYHGLKGDLTPTELQFLTETDEVTHVARVAIDRAGREAFLICPINSTRHRKLFYRAGQFASAAALKIRRRR